MCCRVIWNTREPGEVPTHCAESQLPALWQGDEPWPFQLNTALLDAAHGDDQRTKTECRRYTEGSAECLLDGLSVEAIGRPKELVEASGEVQGWAGEVSASLAGEEGMPLHRQPMQG